MLGAITLRRATGAPTTRRTCSWPRTSGCAPAPRSRTRGSTRAAAEIARALQTSLLPPHLPEIPGAALAAAYHPAWQGLEVGGDFYDVFTTGEGQWYLVIGDVCGKGAEAAAVTALARYTLRTAAARRRSPAAILRWVGDAMLHQDAAGGRFCTIACAHLDFSRARRRAGDRRLRRAPAAGAAARGRARSSCSARRARCSGCCPTPSCRSAAPTCARATRSCSTPTG